MANYNTDKYSIFASSFKDRLAKIGDTIRSIRANCGISTSGTSPPPPPPLLPSPRVSSLPHSTVLILDKSSSMTKRDLPSSRLEAAKAATDRFFTVRASISPADQMSLVVFCSIARILWKRRPISEFPRLRGALHDIEGGDGTDIAEGLKAAYEILAKVDNEPQYLRRAILLTDGHGGFPLEVAQRMKAENILIDVIGIGGTRRAVAEDLLRQVATTDERGFTHYWFCKNSETLYTLYDDLGTGIAWEPKRNDDR